MDMINLEKIETIMHETVGPKWRELADSHLKVLFNPFATKSSGTLAKQSAYVQRKIQRNSVELEKFMDKVLLDSEYERILRTIGLRPELISKELFFQCLYDLQTEIIEKRERDFGDLLLSMAYPTRLPKFNKDAQRIEDRANELEIELVQADKNQGVYVGMVMGMDNQNMLVKFANKKAIGLFFWDLPENKTWPAVFDTVCIKFKDGKVSEFKFKARLT